MLVLVLVPVLVLVLVPGRSVPRTTHNAHLSHTLDKKIVTPAAGCGGLSLHQLDARAAGGPPEPLDIMGAGSEDDSIVIDDASGEDSSSASSGLNALRKAAVAKRRWQKSQVLQ